jgi:ribokinase
MRPPHILVVGSSNTDMIIKSGRIPRPGETVTGGVYTTAAGGKGANQAVAACRAGAHVTLVARVGQDDLGATALQGFVKEGIDIRYIVQDNEAASGVAFIVVDRAGENCITVAPGANSRLTAEDVRRAASLFAEIDMVLIQLETPLPAVAETVSLAQQHHVPVILNPAPAPAQPLPESLLKQIDILTPNEWEAQSLTGIAVTDLASAGRAADCLHRSGTALVIITMGAAGAYISGKEHRGLSRAFSVAAVDTTAAGDVFNAALAVGLSEKKSLAEAVRFAHAAAAISVSRLGAQPSAPRRSEIETFLTSPDRA